MWIHVVSAAGHVIVNMTFDKEGQTAHLARDSLRRRHDSGFRGVARVVVRVRCQMAESW